MRKILLSLVLLLAISLSSCKGKKDVPNKLFTIEVTYLDGYKATKTYELPSESKFYIESYQGGYFLKYNATKQCSACGGDLLVGVLRYKVISIK